MKKSRLALKIGWVSLCLIFVAGLAPGAAFPVAAGGNDKQLNVMHLAPLVKPPPLCVGETRKYQVFVYTGNLLPVGGAMMIVDGRATAFNSMANGNAYVSYQAKKTGDFTFTVNAIKDGYTSGLSEMISGEAQPCEWRIRMWYEESVYSKGKLFEAVCWFKFPNQTFKKDDNSDALVLTTNSSTIPVTYGCRSGALDYPLGSRLTPDVTGTMDIDFSGKYIEGKGLWINLTSQSGGHLPKTITLDIVDSYQGKVVRTVTWGMRSTADIINQSHITGWVANPIFDFKDYQITNSLFLSEKGLVTKGNGTVIVELNKAGK